MPAPDNTPALILWRAAPLLDKYRGTGIVKPYLIFGLTDETYSITATVKLEDDISPKKYYFFLTALNHSYWITGCVLGAVLGMFLPFSGEGVDYAMTALFIVIPAGDLGRNDHGGLSGGFRRGIFHCAGAVPDRGGDGDLSQKARPCGKGKDKRGERQ